MVEEVTRSIRRAVELLAPDYSEISAVLSGS